jgi:hypothetical protein
MLTGLSCFHTMSTSSQLKIRDVVNARIAIMVDVMHYIFGDVPHFLRQLNCFPWNSSPLLFSRRQIIFSNKNPGSIFEMAKVLNSLTAQYQLPSTSMSVHTGAESDLKFSSCSFGRHSVEADTGMLPNSPLLRLTADNDDDPLLLQLHASGAGRKGCRAPKLCACCNAAAAAPGTPAGLSPHLSLAPYKGSVQESLIFC